jgi:hypothetical protein
LPFDDEQVKTLTTLREHHKHNIFILGAPSVLHATLTLPTNATPSDTFFTFDQLTRGILWINGHNLGRYWSGGPQLSLYCPRDYLVPGANEVLVLELERRAYIGSNMRISTRDSPLWS